MVFPLGPRDVKYFVPPLAASGVAGMASELSPFPPRTAVVRALEGGVVSLFQPITHPLATEAAVAVYLLAYPLLLLFTYVGLKREGRGRHVDYAFTYTLVVVASTPIFFFVPVGVTGYALPGVEPLLYDGDGFVQSFMLSVDTLQKALPSLHAGLAGTASLYAPAGYERASWTITGLVLLSTLYLGVHWLVDLGAGVALAYGCFRVTPVLQARLAALREPSGSTPVRGD